MSTKGESLRFSYVKEGDLEGVGVEVVMTQGTSTVTRFSQNFSMG